MAKHEELKNSVIFELGESVEEFKPYFTGTSYLNMLVTDPQFNCPIGNVTFEPGCRNNWHSHEGGQILLVTGGEGWYQEEGQAARKLTPGDVVTIPAHVKHWHGAAADSWFVHLAITTNPQAGGTEWLESVTDEEYARLGE